MIIKLTNLCTNPVKLEIVQNHQVLHIDRLELEQSVEQKISSTKGDSFTVHVMDESTEWNVKNGIIRDIGLLFGNTILEEQHPTFKESLDDRRILFIENAAGAEEESEEALEVLIMYSKEEKYFAVSKDKRIRVRQRYDIGKEELKKRLRDWYIACGIEIALYLAVLIICTVVTFFNGAESRWFFLLLTVVGIGVPMKFLVKSSKRDCIEVGRRRLLER